MRKLVQKSIHLFANLILIFSTLLPLLNLSASSVVATTVGATNLLPGTDYDTGDHTWTNQQYLNSNSYSTAGSTSFTSFTNGGKFNLTTNSINQAGYAIFNGALDMRNAVTMTAQIFVQDTNLYANWQNSGDSLGFILTPQSTATLKANVGNATGPQLGIGGLANSFFVGRDLFTNTALQDNYIDGNTVGVATRGGGNEISIRHTGVGGTLLPLAGTGYGSNNPTGTNTPGDAWMNAPDNTFVNNPGASATENVSLNWQPDSTNTAPTGFSSGTLTFSLTAQVGGAPFVLSTKANMANSMSVGFVGATGGNKGTQTLTLLSSNTISSAKGQAQVQVNYINSATGAAIGTMPLSTIEANVGDKVSVAAPDGTASSTMSTASAAGAYTYVAPNAPAGYTFSKITYGSTGATTAPLVANFDPTQVNPNQINVYYTPNLQTGMVNYLYQLGTPGTTLNADGSGALPSSNPTVAGIAPALPANQSLSGGTDSVIVWASPTLPAGYVVDHVTAPDGKSYATVEQAIASHPTFIMGANNFTIFIAAQLQTARINFMIDPSSLPAGIAIPETPAPITISNTGTGMTGAPIALADIAEAQDRINQILSDSSFNSWSIYAYSDPMGKSYTDVNANLATAVAGNGQVLLGNDNTYTVYLSYQGTLSLQVPDQIDFGQLTVSSANMRQVSGKMNSDVIVIDERQVPTAWTLQLAEEQPLQERDAAGTVRVGGISFEGLMTFGQNVLSSTNAITVYQQSVGSSGTVLALPTYSSAFSLMIPLTAQKVGVQFQGQVVWTLSVAP